MSKHIHGGNIYKKSYAGRKMLDFSANINPLGPPAAVLDALSSSGRICANYPDPECGNLRLAISESERVPVEYIFCSNGAAEIIYRIAFALKPASTLLPAPTFAEYEEALTTAGGSVTRHVLDESTGFRIGWDFVDAIGPGTDMVFICNPNNPVGISADRDVLLAALDKCRECGATLVMDECFIDFMEDTSSSLKDMLEAYGNLIIVRAFTKIFAMAGLRLGYCLTSNRETISSIALCGQPWSVSSVAQACGIAALTDREHLVKTVALISQQREYITTALRTLGLKVYESHTNFILFRSGDHSLCRKLEGYDILIRSCENFAGLGPGYYRAAVKSEPDNRRLISALKEVL
ncbi:threonine-phosphate decarboxylase [Clostridia bacterium]|nr:threonine-phosphate decarboxylase [Clostridia bacterium]